MCGIVGVAGNLRDIHSKVFRDMLIFDQVRGLDSTGVVSVPKNSAKPIIEKEIGSPENLWSFGMSKLMDYRGHVKVPPRVLIGHNRAATIGQVTLDNAHPFSFGHITGVHNGSLVDWYGLEKDHQNKSFDVDSKALFKTISNRGVQDTWKDFVGAASIVFWNEEDETLNFARNRERPMRLAWSKAGDVLFWASEAWMIEVAANRHGVELRPIETVTKKPDGTEVKTYANTYSTATDKAFSFELTPKGINYKESKELEPIKKIQTTTGGGGGRFTYGVPKTGKTNGLWAKNLRKAGKELVNVVFTYRYDVTSYTNGAYNPYFVGQIEEGEFKGEQVRLYPRTFEGYYSFLKDNKGERKSYALQVRPRHVKNFYGHEEGFGVELTNIKPYSKMSMTIKDIVTHFHKPRDKKDNVHKLYRSLSNRLVSEEVWHKNLSRLGGCCDMCGMSITIEESETCAWQSDSVFCPGCVADGTYRQYLTA